MNRLTTGIILTLLLSVAAHTQQPNPQLDKLFASAQHKATVVGDLKGAVADYELILARAGGNRSAAARALMGIANAYRDLGDARERETLSRIVTDYGDQPAASMARSRLGALTNVADGAANGASSGAVWTLPSALAAQGHISRDGRWLPYIDWRTNNLALHDLKTGRDVTLTDQGVRNSVPKQQYPGYSRISPDGKKIVFSWFNSQRYEIRLLDLNPLGRARPVTLYHNPDVEYMHPFAWSPDGALVAVGLQRVDRTGQLALLSVRDGSLRVLKSFPWREEMSGVAFSPDGKWLAYDLPPEDDSLLHDVYAISLDGRREMAIATHRRNDWVIAWSRDGRHIIFGSDRTGSKQLWAQRIVGSELPGPPQILASDFNGTFLGFSDDGALYDVLTTRTASLFRLAQFDFDKGVALSQGIDPGEEYFSTNSTSHAEWSADGSRLALGRRTGGDPAGNLISVVRPDGTRVRDVRPQVQTFGPFVWSRDGRSFYAGGMDFKGRAGVLEVDSTSGEGRVIASHDTGGPPIYPVLGESTDGRELYYGYVNADGLYLVARELATGAEREIAVLSSGASQRALGFWNPDISPDRTQISAWALQPDGRRRLVVIDVGSGAQREISAQLDQLVMWSPDGDSVFAWRGQGVASQMVRISTLTGEATPVQWTFGTDSYKFRVHPDGRRVTYVVVNAPAHSQVRRLTGVLTQLTKRRAEDPGK